MVAKLHGAISKKGTGGRVAQQDDAIAFSTVKDGFYYYGLWTSGNFNAGITNTNTASTLGGAWDTSSTDLIKQINTVKRVIHRNCGVMPDRFVTSNDVWTDGIMIYDAIQAGLQATQKPAGASDFENAKNIISSFFGLEGAIDVTLFDSANVSSTITPTYLFPKSVLVYVSNARVDRIKAMRFGF
ncbi:MAG: hypothetical protein IH898_08280, partial [Planctomycetes bacterium]|nr:hypothetical protein [Planctomycetota bacterium]